MDYERIKSLVKSTKDIIIDPTRPVEITTKGRANFVTQIDVAVQEYLRQKLQALYPEVLLLSEEQARITVDADKAYWILDPIDGTQNFIRHTNMSAVSLGYYAHGALRFSVIYAPFTNELFHAVRGQGAYLNGQRLHVTDNKLADSLMSIGTSPYEREYTASNWPMFQEVFSRCLDIRRYGSAAIDLAYVAAGRFDGYFEHNLKPWDYAGGMLLIHEAGGKVTDFTGQPVVIGQNCDVCATNGVIDQELLPIIQKYWPGK